MEIYLDGQMIEGISTKSSFEDILKEIRCRLKGKIIEKIYVDDSEVNEHFLLDNNYNLEQISTLRFETKEVDNLIKETIHDANEYLPKLKEGILETAQLFRHGKLEEGNLKYELCLKGLEWYINVLQKILSLLDNKELVVQGKKLVINFNEVLSDLINSYQNQDMIFVADLLEYEIVGFIDDFIVFNKELME